LKRNDILNTPKFGHVKINVPWATLAPNSRGEKPQLFSRHAACFGNARRFTTEIPGFSRVVAARDRQRNAEHSRLISFAFYSDRATQSLVLAAAAAPMPRCIRVLARFCSTSHQACTAGSDLI
jgi:hypothetical protein